MTEPAPPSPTAPDPKLTRYKLGSLLGQGGQGRTHLALDRETGQGVAVKVIQLGGSDDWKPFDLFERECEVLRALSHPGIPTYHDTFANEEDGTYYLVMELIRGESLKQLMDDKQLLGEAQLWNILHQTLEILEYLHDRRPPVIHRDIKPANLVRRPDNSLALVDFGGVRVALREDGGSTVVGTFGYMAPEQLHGEATPATDIYGLGATLAALATGKEADKLPREGLKVDLQHVISPGALRDLLSRMLEPDPGDRLASVEAVRDAIGEVESTSRGGKKKKKRGAPGPDYDLDPDDPDAPPLSGAPTPVRVLLRIFGGMGYVGLVLLDAIMLPLVFVMLGAVWSSNPDKRKQLKGKKDTARRVLGSGRRAMKALAKGRDPYHAIERQLSGREERRGLPPARGRGRGRGRRRGRR